MSRFRRLLLPALWAGLLLAPAALATEAPAPVGVMAPERSSLRPGFTLPESSSEAVELTSEEAPIQPPSRAARLAAGAPPKGSGAPFARSARAPALASDILLLTRRRNE